jgi:hypothetical protein
MTLDLFRQNTLNALQAAIDNKTTAAVNMQAKQFTTVDQYAMSQAETLAEARALLLAQQVIQAEFTKLMKPQQAESNASTPKPKTEEVY